MSRDGKYRSLSGTFLRHFIEYALLKGSGGTPPCMGEGLWQKKVLGHF